MLVCDDGLHLDAAPGEPGDLAVEGLAQHPGLGVDAVQGHRTRVHEHQAIAEAARQVGGHPRSVVGSDGQVDAADDGAALHARRRKGGRQGRG